MLLRAENVKRADSRALIELKNVTKSYKKGDSTVTPLAELNLRVDEGEFVALMGPSGSGKTTLLNLIAGIDQPTSGQVLVNGTDIAKLSRTKLSRWRSANIGYILPALPSSAGAHCVRER